MARIKVGDKVYLRPNEDTEFFEIFEISRERAHGSLFKVIDIDHGDEFPYYVEGTNDEGNHIDFWLEESEILTLKEWAHLNSRDNV